MNLSLQIDIGAGHVAEDTVAEPKNPWWLPCDGSPVIHNVHPELYAFFRQQSSAVDQNRPNIPPREEEDPVTKEKRMVYTYICAQPIKVNAIINVEL